METIIELSPVVYFLVPVVIGLTELTKPFLDSKYSPLASLVFGLAGAVLFPAPTLGVTIISGIVIGLTASGLYSGVKAVKNN